jgi:hypothetical protein
MNVNDLAKVDLEVLNEESNCEAYKAKLSAYYKASKANLDAQLALYDHDLCWKRDYTSSFSTSISKKEKISGTEMINTKVKLCK